MSTLREKILDIARTLPPAPRVFAELDRLLRDANSGLGEIVALVKRDSTLVGHIIRVSNSAVYGGEQPTGSAEEAVVRIGFQEVFRVVGQVASVRLAERPLRSYGIDTDQLREHMLHTAFVCEHLATECDIDPRSAYTAGLMRPLGILVLDRLAEQYSNLTPYHPVHDPDYLVWEGRSFGLSSCEVAAIVLREWSFPADIVEAIQTQYLVRSEDLGNRFGCLLNLSCGLVADEGHGLIGETRHWSGSTWKLDALGLTEARFHAARARSREAFAAFQSRLRGEPEPRRRTTRERGKPDPTRTHGSVGPDSSNFPVQVRVLEASDEPPVQSPPTPAALRAPATTSAVAAAVDPRADEFTLLMRNYQDMVFSTAARITGNETQAEDISQEVFLKAYENFDALRGGTAAGGWLKTVATNLSINHLSRYRNRWRFFSEFRSSRKPDDDDDSPIEFAAPDTFFTDIDAADRHALVENALAKLPDHQRVPLVLYHFEDMPYDEIAKKLHVSLAKVKTDILRARAALAKILMRAGSGGMQPAFPK